VVAVILTVPGDNAVTTPLLLTVAMAVLSDDHVTFWFVALEGEMVTVRVAKVLPTWVDMYAKFSFIPVTRTSVAVTVTAQVAIPVPSPVLAVIVADPTATAVILPFASTAATAVLLEAQFTVLAVPFVGETVATNVSAVPAVIVSAVLFSVRPVFTFTTQVAVLPPSAVFTVIVVVPVPTTVNFPALSTVAADVSLEVHVTAWLVALDGATVAVKLTVFPSIITVRAVISTDKPPKV